jgi:FtsZ-interacting cell division protein ZipA
MTVLEIIVLAVVVTAILVALFVFLPRMRERGRTKLRERELKQRRRRVASEQREQAEERARLAEAAERRARIAEQEAQRERAEAQLRQERAALHEQGMADHELIEDHERDRFAGTSAVRGDDREARRDGDRSDEQDDADHGLLGRFRRRRESKQAA